ncbi:hypothetical protein HID58_091937, partial [Brassica napus]
VRLSPLRQISVKSSLSGGSTTPRGSPRVHSSGRTPRRGGGGGGGGGAVQWFRSSRLVYWLLLITLWTYLGLGGRMITNKVEFLRFGGKLRKDVVHVDVAKSKGMVPLLMTLLNALETDVSLSKKDDVASRRSLSSRRKTRKASRTSRGKQKVTKAVESKALEDEQDPQLPMTNATYGNLSCPFGFSSGARIDGRDLRQEVQILNALFGRGDSFWFSRALDDCASYFDDGAGVGAFDCGATVSAVVLSRRGGLMQELTRRRIKVVEDKGELSFKTAMKADLIIAGSAVCTSWIDQYMNHHPSGGNAIFLSESQSKQWLTWCEEEHIRLAFVAGIPSSLNTPTHPQRNEGEETNTTRVSQNGVRITDADMLVMSLSSINRKGTTSSPRISLSEREQEAQRIRRAPGSSRQVQSVPLTLGNAAGDRNKSLIYFWDQWVQRATKLNTLKRCNGNLSKSVFGLQQPLVLLHYTLQQMSTSQTPRELVNKFGRVTTKKWRMDLQWWAQMQEDKEIVEHNVTGLLHPMGRLGNKDLAHSLLFLLRNKDASYNGIQGRKKVEKVT